MPNCLYYGYGSYYRDGQTIACYDWDPTWLTWCDTHQHWTRVIKEGAFTGFAGGSCLWADLACGVYLVDEADDLLAAI